MIVTQWDQITKNMANFVTKDVPFRWKGAFWMSKSVDLWYFLISLRATVPGLNRYFLTPVVTGALFLAIFCAWRFFFMPSVLFLATALERTILTVNIILLLQNSDNLSYIPWATRYLCRHLDYWKQEVIVQKISIKNWSDRPSNPCFGWTLRGKWQA